MATPAIDNNSVLWKAFTPEDVERYVDDERVAWNNPEGRVLSPIGVASMHDDFNARVRDWKSCSSLQLTCYDPGSAAYRYHSACNSTLDGKGVSAFVRFGDENPFCSLRQYDGILQRDGVRRLLHEADVVHVHMDYKTLILRELLGRWPDRSRQLLVRHYHGSQPTVESEPSVLVENGLDDNEGAVQVGARLYHQRFSDRMHWLPIPMPVTDYERLREQHWVPIAERRNKRVRIAHSPTHASIKGTIILETAISDLVLKGVPVELVMISKLPHGQALARKATCDLTFDSFWLGIQGSGLEAACMGQAVIAGDADVKAEYERAVGDCPYTYVSDFETLRETIERLVVDESYRIAEAHRVGHYVREYHDYPRVGARYWQIVRDERAKRGLVNE